MTIDLQRVINSSLSLHLISSLARSLPPKLGYRLAYRIADWVATQKDSKLIRAVRANQWVISGAALQGEALDHAVRETMRYSAYFLFDLYHYAHSPHAIRHLVVLDPSFQQLIHRPEYDQRGLIIVGLHLGGFDLILQWLCRQGMKPLVLTIPNPQGGRRLEYEVRKKTGMNLMPASVGALRQALQQLQRGGLVLTGIDRPVERPRVFPRFFNQGAALPIHHIFLATKAHVPVNIAVTTLQQDGKYHVMASDLIEMDIHPDQELGLLRNAEKVLSRAEEFIRQAPQQWSVPLPVWPQMMDLVPTGR
jgi:lauroyl/myristoyl acyltransferase